MLIEFARKAGVLNRRFASYRQQNLLSRWMFWPLGFGLLCLVYYIVNSLIGLITPVHLATLVPMSHGFLYFVSILAMEVIAAQILMFMMLPYIHGYKLGRMFGLGRMASVRFGIMPHTYRLNGSTLRPADLLPTLRQLLSEKFEQPVR
ncbi:MAG: hypothetical protein ACQR33_03060 [Candidatus Saccharibacteria bacterium]